MSKDNFKDEFEKNKQAIEREESGIEDNVQEDEQVESVQVFPPRGTSRRQRSQKRREEKEQHEETDTDVEENDDARDKRRKRSIVASATGVGGSVVGNVSQPQAHAETVTPEPEAGPAVEDDAPEVETETYEAERYDEEEEAPSGKKWLPLLAALLILIPIIILISLYINQQNDKKNDQITQTPTEETADQGKVTSDDTKKEADKADKKEAATTEKATTEQATTEMATTEAATTEAVTTEAPATGTRGGTHVVGAQENLYRIAIQYYGSGSEANIEKIRKANGITGNNISAGQTLVIPE